MTKGLKEFKRLAYENACKNCQYFVKKDCQCNCVWLEIEKELKTLDVLKECYDCGMIQLRATFDGKYYIDYSTHFMEISKEQYDTLYEVFEK